MLATDPGQSATVLVALALMGRTPAKIRDGNVMKLPPPATELRVPPRMAEINSSRNCSNDISKLHPSTGSLAYRKHTCRGRNETTLAPGGLSYVRVQELDR